MTDEPEIPTTLSAPTNEDEKNIVPAKKRGRPATGRKPPQRFRSGACKPNTRKLVWLDSARVLDIAAYQRLRDAGLGGKKISKALGTTLATAQKLMSGTHWQQTPDKVRLFNKARGGSLNPETGQPTPDDLAKFGVPFAGPTKHDTQGQKDLRQIVEATGISPALIEETVRGLRILSGAVQEGDLPDKVDTKWHQDSIDQTLGRIMTLLRDPVKMGAASYADLTRAANMLYEKRALLRGEPTAIVRNEQRGGLAEVAALLLKEVGRRGIDLNLEKTEYREVANG